NKALSVLLNLEQYLDESPLMRRNYHQQLYKLYTLLNDYKNAVVHLEKYSDYRFATTNDSTLSILKDAEVSRTRIVEELKRENIEKSHALETARLNAARNRMLVVIIALVVILLLFFGMFRMKKSANQILTEKNQILNSQKTEIEAQRDEIVYQKDIITEQMHEVERINSKLVSSINYAERIQRAVVSKIEEVKAIFPDSFVFYKPRDIVSGDFYRCCRCGKYSVMITADCTGHGIPGAFLSMLGVSGLKECMVTEYDAANPGIVLDRMRQFIKTTLVSSQKDKVLDDGMDMTICCYDYQNMELRYALAGQTAFIIRNGEAIKLKGDIMPVGFYVREREHFQTLSIPIERGDMVYSFSDGIQDQLGGVEQRKLLQKSLLEILKSIVDKPSDEQCNIIDQKIHEWRGDTPQVDDMTLIGIRV
ncbi:MAG: serine/threonine-protein phosphatase, partial [Bacteroidales bacterium]|nr:serine/threonine-protein phosphatase [Bacteroidales bacterium]